MKYNKREIMLTMWALVKKYGMTRSAALRLAWAQAKAKKEEKKMRGTEKQIAWAKDIQAAVVRAIDYITKVGQQYKGNPKIAEALAKLSTQREAVVNCEYAGDLIECFRNVSIYTTDKDRAESFTAACQTTRPNSPAQRAMLGK